MNKNALKVLSIFFILIIVLSNFSYATDYHEIAQKIEEHFTNGTTNPSSLNPISLGNKILGVLTYIGYGLAVCVILITGIQFLTANAQKKAQLKEKLWLIAIGVFILAAGIPIYTTIRAILMTLRNT